MAALLGGACIESKTYTPLPPPDPSIPTVPQLRMPQNGAYEGSVVAGKLQPRFVWEPSTVAEGELRYELQYSADAMFAQGVTTVPTAELSHQPAAALAVSTTAPVGRRYSWRVRACAGETCSAYSKPWSVNLGRSIKDFNGDGYDDIIVGWHRNPDNGAFSGRANVYFGGPGVTFDSTADGSVADSVAGDWFGESVAAAGDFNGDGFGDVLVGANQSDRGGVDSGAAYLYFGGAGQTFNTQVDVIFVGESAQSCFGSAIAGGRDLNGDGFSDVVISSSTTVGGPSNAGCASVFFGASDAGGGRVEQPVAKICGTDADQLVGVRLNEVGDVNGDGFGDLSIAANFVRQGGTSRKCAVMNYYGGPGQMFDVQMDGLFAGETNDQCSLVVAAAGDVNSDGFADVIGVTSESVRLFLGGKEPDSRVDMVFNADSSGFIQRTAAAGDVNGDGIDDIMFGAKTQFDRRVYVHLGLGAGGSSPVSPSPAATIVRALDSYFGYSLGTPGDVNADGFDDLVLGDPVDNNATGRADLYFGNAGASMDTALDGFIVSGVPMSSFGLQVALQAKASVQRRNAARRMRARQ